jgi:DNA-binding Lrp family transcriptional regulator
MRSRTDTKARAYVLIEAETGQLDTVVSVLRAIPEVVEAGATIGLCDIIAVIESPDQNMIGRLVITAIHSITGVKRTTTCLVIR